MIKVTHSSETGCWFAGNYANQIGAGVTIPVKNDKSDSFLPSLHRYHQVKYLRRHNVILATH